MMTRIAYSMMGPDIRAGHPVTVVEKTHTNPAPIGKSSGGRTRRSRTAESKKNDATVETTRITKGGDDSGKNQEEAGGEPGKGPIIRSSGGREKNFSG